MRKNKLIVFALVAVFALGVGVFGIGSRQASAAEFIKPDETGNVSVGPEKSVKNLYTVGGMVTIGANVKKDLFVAGGNVIVNGNVEDDLFIAGGNIVIKGNVGGSLRAGGGNVVIEGKIKEDLIIGGGSVLLSGASSVGGDIVAGAGNLDIQGPVSGDILAGSGKVTINSAVGGKVNIEVEELTLGDSAKLQGDLTYKSSKEAKISDKSEVKGLIDFIRRDGKISFYDKAGKFKGVLPWLFAGFLSLVWIAKLAMCLVAALVIFRLFKKQVEAAVGESAKNFWPCLGIGFAGVILTPIAAGILFVTVIGAYLGGLLLALYGISLLLGGILAAIFFGSLTVGWYKKDKNIHVTWKTITIGVIIFGIVRLIPVLGWIVAAAFILSSLGAIYKMAYKTIA